MRSGRSWPRSHPRLALAVLAAVTVLLLWAFWGVNQITRSNYDRIQVGMSRAEVHRLLGPPDLVELELGLVDGPETYILNRDQSVEERRRRGFRDCRRDQWTSPEIQIIVISDMEDRVVCRYNGPGQSLWLLTFLRSWRSQLF